MNYAEKYKDPRWQKLRLEVFERAKWKCSNCGSAEGDSLHAHHLFYKKGSDPWDYDAKDIVCFCSKCHDDWHTLHRILSVATRTTGHLLAALRGVIAYRFRLNDESLDGIPSMIVMTEDQAEAFAHSSRRYSLLDVLRASTITDDGDLRVFPHVLDDGETAEGSPMEGW